MHAAPLPGAQEQRPETGPSAFKRDAGPKAMGSALKKRRRTGPPVPASKSGPRRFFLLAAELLSPGTGVPAASLCRNGAPLACPRMQTTADATPSR